MLNKVILMGRLTKEPELRHTPQDIPVVSFSIAVDRGYGDDKQVDFVNVVAWRHTAEFVSKWFTKGQLIAVSGRLQVRPYSDRDGNKRTATEVVAEEVFFAERKKDGNPSTADAVPLPLGKGGFGAEGFSDWEEISGDDGQLPF